MSFLASTTIRPWARWTPIGTRALTNASWCWSRVDWRASRPAICWPPAGRIAGRGYVPGDRGPSLRRGGGVRLSRLPHARTPRDPACRGDRRHDGAVLPAGRAHGNLVPWTRRRCSAHRPAVLACRCWRIATAVRSRCGWASSRFLPRTIGITMCGERCRNTARSQGIRLEVIDASQDGPGDRRLKRAIGMRRGRFVSRRRYDYPGRRQDDEPISPRPCAAGMASPSSRIRCAVLAELADERVSPLVV